MSALGPPVGGVGARRPTRGNRPEPTLVLKFGSSVLRGEADLPIAVHEIYRWWRLGYRIVAVVSAFAGVTDRLAATTGAAPSQRLKRPTSVSAGVGPQVSGAAMNSIANVESSAFAILLAAGERQAAALLVLELERAGIPAQVLDPAGIGLTTREAGLEADPARVDRRRIERALDACPVAVLPGFQAVDGRGVATLLGRGGSDMTAVFVAHRLGARCRLLKDVPGICESRPPAPDNHGAGTAVAPASERPADHAASPRGAPSAGADGQKRPCLDASSSAADRSAPRPRLFSSLTWHEAAAVGNGVVQDRTLAFAERERFPLEVAAPAQGFATCIGDRLASLVVLRDTAPLDVAILGLGTVGQAVYRRLAALPRLFRVVGVAVRDRARHRDGAVPDELLADDPWAVLERPADVVVEALPGAEPARALIERALAAGRAVVTANKAALAAAPHLLEAEATLAGPLYASAAAGGAVPVLETASRLRATDAVEAVHGVLNGTSNYVLERLEAGATLADALAEARRRGLAEADPTADLDGSDVARKLILLAHAAFGVTLPFETIPRHHAEEIAPDRVRAAARAGKRLRSVGSLTLRDGRPRAAVRLRELSPEDFLAGAREEENRVVFERRGARPLRLAGKGAGGRPTAEAVLADLFDLWRLRRAGVEGGASSEASTGLYGGRTAAGREAGRFGRNGGDAVGSEAADLCVGRGRRGEASPVAGEEHRDEPPHGPLAEEVAP